MGEELIEDATLPVSPQGSDFEAFGNRDEALNETRRKPC
jgi:hypothetical protein